MVENVTDMIFLDRTVLECDFCVGKQNMCLYFLAKTAYADPDSCQRESRGGRSNSDNVFLADEGREDPKIKIPLKAVQYRLASESFSDGPIMAQH